MPVTPRMPQAQRTISLTQLYPLQQKKIKLCNEKNLKDRKSKAILEPVKKMLCEFSEQNEEFARAVTAAENLENLIDEVGKKLPAAVSDLDVYQQIVGKIFPGAKVTFAMQIHMSEYELEEPDVAEQKTDPVTLDLGNLIDW